MGKSLVIKGADFSSNKIAAETEYAFGLTDAQIVSIDSAGAVLNKSYLKVFDSTNNSKSDDLQGKIVGIKAYIHTAGNIMLYKVNKSDYSDATLIKTLAFESTGLQEISFDAVEVGEDYYLGLNTSEANVVYYNASADLGIGFNLRNMGNFPKSAIAIDFNIVAE